MIILAAVNMLLLGAGQTLAVIPVTVAILSIAFLCYLEKDKHTKFKELEDRLKLLNDRIEVITLSRGMGR